MARRLAQVARLGRLAWWTLSLPSLLSLGRLGREVAYISDLSKQSPHFRCWRAKRTCRAKWMTEHRYRHLLRGGASAGSDQGRPDNATCFLLGTSSLGLAFYC